MSDNLLFNFLKHNSLYIVNLVNQKIENNNTYTLYLFFNKILSMLCNLCGSMEFNSGSLFRDKPEMLYVPGRDYCPSCWNPFKSLKDPCYIEYKMRNNRFQESNRTIRHKKCVLEIYVFFFIPEFKKILFTTI